MTHEPLESGYFDVHGYHVPLPILVSSQPESHLTHSFTTGSLQHRKTPINRMTTFLTDYFSQVKKTHRMSGHLDHSWSSVDVLEGFVKKSSGQFIYAPKAAVKYVSSIRHQPADRLSVVLRILPPRHAHEIPFSELDAL